jgi:hypothetical protein
MASGLALAAAAKLAPIIIDALAPEVQAAFKSLTPGLVKITPAPIDGEVAVATNLQRALPAISPAEVEVIRKKIGIAVAIYKTDHPGDDLQSDAAWMDIQSRSLAAIEAEGLYTARIPVSTLRQMVATGIEMNRAGLGTEALKV